MLASPSPLSAVVVLALLTAVPIQPRQRIRSVADVRKLLHDTCPSEDQRCIINQCDRWWADPESALWIVTYLSEDTKRFADDYLRGRYQREQDGNVKVVLLSKLMERNKVENLSFIIDRLPEVSRIGREGDRPGVLALRYLQNTVMIEYKCDDRRFPIDTAYRSWVKGLYLTWYRESIDAGISYNPAVAAT